MILELDIGNSRIKWRLRDSDSVGSVSASDHCSHDTVRKLDPALLARFQQAKEIKVSSVVDTLQQPLQALAVALAVPIRQAATEDHCAGVTNSYSIATKMGVDRWLAMLAAHNSLLAAGDQAASCVIDCGTSLTIDFLSADGVHEGGLILPGRRLLLQSLSRNTEKVLFDPDSDDGELALGNSTEQAVFNGNLHMLIGSIQQACASAASVNGRAFFLCGGDGAWLAPNLQARLGIKATVLPDLVLDGLQYSLPS